MTDHGPIWQFGPFELQSRNRQLLKAGAKLKLQEQPFQILYTLIERRGEVVTRDELRHRVWPDNTFVDFDNGLNVAIAKLRQLLGDHAETPAYIETLPRIGYRFIAAVEERAAAETTQRRANRLRRWWVLGMAAAIVIAAAVTLGIGRWPGVERAPIPHRPSVAILGFRNLSDRPDQNWLSTALSEMLATELAAGERLRIIPGETVARTKIDMALHDAESYSARTLARIKKSLGADFVVVGSYLETASPPRRIRLDLRLQDAKSGETIANLPENGSEDELASLVAQAGALLRQRLSGGGVESDAGGVRAALPPTIDTARLYAEGLNKLRRFDALGARGLLGQAVAADPGYALAHAALSDAWSALGYAEVAKEEARKAWQLSSPLPAPERLSIEARYRQTNSEWDQAIRIYQRLVQQFPDNAEYGMRLAGSQINAGKATEALATLDRLHELPFPMADEAAIEYARSQAAERLGDFERAQGAAAEAASLAHQREAQILEADALALECRQLVQLSRLDQAASACQSAREIYARTGDRLGLASSMAYLAAAYCNQGAINEARNLYAQALEINREIGNARSDAQWALNGLAVLLLQQGDLAGSRKLYEESLGMARMVGSRPDEVSALGNIGSTLLIAGNLQRARDMFQQALKQSRSIAAKAVGASMLNNLGHTLYLQGELPQAAKMLAEAVDADRQTGAKLESADALSWLGRVHLAQADWEAARRNFEESVRLAGEINGPIFGAHYRLVGAELALATGRPVEAERPIREGLEVFHRAKVLHHELEARILLARALLDEGKMEDASQEVARAELLARDSQQRAERLAFAIVAARAKAATRIPSQVTRARRDLQTTIASAGRDGFQGYHLEARLALGSIDLQHCPESIARGRLEKLVKDARASGFQAIGQDGTLLLSKLVPGAPKPVNTVCD